jgi:nucleoid-associated protein YgaU
MNQLRPSTRALTRLQIVAACVLICVSFLFSVSSTNAQDLAEAARQEKARKAAQAQKQSHVYTNEDLQHSQILTPEDRTIVEARKKNAAPPAVNETSPATEPTQDAAAPESLGEIARRVRQEKAARQAEQARKVPPPAPFPMEMPHETILAHPKPLSPALVAPSSAPAKPSQPAAPVGSVKRNPFSRATISAVPRNNSISAPQPKSASPSTPAPVVVPPTTMRSSPLVSSSHPESVLIQPGDTLWNLSRHYLGKASRWHEFLTRNPGIGDPRRIQPGAVLLVPPAERKSERSSTLESGEGVSAQPADTISVQPGDSLWKIAAQHFGNGADWPCLANANPDLRDVERIYPGQTLSLPASCSKLTPASPKE